MMTQEIWIASGNPSKSKELVYFAQEVFSEASAIRTREPRGVEENKPTFEGNAKLKAHALVRELIDENQKDFVVLADDSGLCVDLLGGIPGVHSGRYAGPKSSNSRENLEKLLHDLGFITLDIKKRTGQYVCALYCVVVREGSVVKEFVTEGVLQGLIGLGSQGTEGYAYDSIFLNPETQLSYAQISYEEKQKDSHRKRAFSKLKTLVQSL